MACALGERCTSPAGFCGGPSPSRAAAAVVLDAQPISRCSEG
jgi:hypothetical protein